MNRLLLVLVTFLGTPTLALASVIINEVAWMGTHASPNHEWIELYNDSGNDTAVDGWVLTDGANLSIPLSGTIPAGEYVVLERTSEESAPGTAFLLYTGALVNTGATLTLRRDDGTIEDQVAGGENWSNIGGDNATKETAQYTTAGWRTGEPTPGAVNSANVLPGTSATAEENSNTIPSVANKTISSQHPNSRDETRTKATPLSDPPVGLSLSIKAQPIAYVGQSVRFTAVPKGLGKTLTASLVHQWNFGDMGVAVGSSTTHRYAYPGSYIVTLRSAFKRHEVLARQEITILPVTLSLTWGVDGAIQIHNDARYDIDVSDFRVLVGSKERVFPRHSFIMARQTVTMPTLPTERSQVVMVKDVRGQVVASLMGWQTTASTFPLVPTLDPRAVTPVPVTESAQLPTKARFISAQLAETAVGTTTAETVSSPIELTNPNPSELPSSEPPVLWPYVLLGVLIGTAAGGLWRGPWRITPTNSRS
jgi:hypothetical protein